MKSNRQTHLEVLFTIMASPSRTKEAITLETKYELFEMYKRGDSPMKKTSQENLEFHQTLIISTIEKITFICEFKDRSLYQYISKNECPIQFHELSNCH